MAKSPSQNSSPASEQQLAETVRRRVQRKQQATRVQDRSIWFGLGMFGLVGWAVAIPTLAGIALGWWLDSLWPSRVSWTLTFLFLGAVVGCWNAWYWIGQERGERD